MSVCTFIASNHPLLEVRPPQDYPLLINLDNGTVFDGDADDNYFLLAFEDVKLYTDMTYAVCLQWNYTAGRAEEILKYIKFALQNTDCVELWHVWLTGYYEFEDRPYIHRKTIAIDELKCHDIRELDNAEIWNKPDRYYPARPSFYCLQIVR